MNSVDYWALARWQHKANKGKIIRRTWPCWKTWSDNSRMSREKIKRVTRHVSADDGAATRVVCCSRRVDWTDRDSSSEDHRIVFLLDDRGIGIDTYGRETSSERSEEKRTRMITRRWAMMMKETHALVQVETILLHFSGGEDRTNKSQLLRTSTVYTEWWRRSSLVDSRSNRKIRQKTSLT